MDALGGKRPLPFPRTAMSREGAFPWSVPSFLPLGTSRATPVSPSPSRVRRGNGVLLIPPARPAAGYPQVGDTQSWRNCWDFGVGRQKKAAKNRPRGSADVRLCPEPPVALLRGTSPHWDWQCPRLWSFEMVGHHHPRITILGSPQEQGQQSQRGIFLGRGTSPAAAGNSHWTEGESLSQEGFGFKRGQLGAGDLPAPWGLSIPKQLWHCQVLEGLGD